MEPCLKGELSVLGLCKEPSKVLPEGQTNYYICVYEYMGFSQPKGFLIGSFNGKVFWVPVEIFLGLLCVLGFYMEHLRVTQ